MIPLVEWVSSGGRISEAVSHGRASKNRKYTPFPEDRTDDIAIKNWLIYNGFKNIGTTKGENDMIAFGEKCYSMGPYVYSDKLTWWIKFWDGYLFFIIRTCKDEFLKGKPACESANDRLVYMEVKYEDIIDYFYE